jgi:nitrate reductase NapE component
MGQQTFRVIQSVIDALIKRKVELIQNLQLIINLHPVVTNIIIGGLDILVIFF